MRTYDEAFAAARDEATFSNSSQWEVWAAKNCDRCIHDKPSREGDDANGCPLILVALMSKRPAEWVTETKEQEVFADYTCTEFRDEDDRDPKPQPVPVSDGQGELLPQALFEGVRRPRADHQHAAQQAREMPGQWVLAGTYSSSASAKHAARQVASGDRMPAYLPAGTYRGRSELTQDGADLWVCYVAADEQQTADFRASLAAGLTEDFKAFSQRLQDAIDTKGAPA